MIKVFLQADIDLLVNDGTSILELIRLILVLDLIISIERGRGGRNLLFLLDSLGNGLFLDRQALLIFDCFLFLLRQNFLLASTNIENGTCLLDVRELGVLVHVRVGVVEHQLGNRGQILGARPKHSLLTHIRRRVKLIHHCAPCRHRMSLLLVHQLVDGLVDWAHSLRAILGEGQEKLRDVVDVLRGT